MNLALLQQFHGRSSAEFFAQLVGAIDSLPGAVDEICRLMTDGDRLSTERLERLAERLSGLSRLTLQTRAAIVNETRDPEAA